jgi:hypothetical protein
MQTVATPAETMIPNVDLATLRAIVADLQAAHPAAGSRVEKGAAIFLFRHVERSASGAWYVQSETDCEVEYILAGDQCSCRDFERHGDASPCKHQFCRAIYQRAERIEADAEAPIAWELTEAAYTALDLLGEVPDVAPQCARCHAEPAIARHCDGLGAACVSRELFGDDAA